MEVQRLRSEEQERIEQGLNTSVVHRMREPEPEVFVAAKSKERAGKVTTNKLGVDDVQRLARILLARAGIETGGEALRVRQDDIDGLSFLVRGKIVEFLTKFPNPKDQKNIGSISLGDISDLTDAILASDREGRFGPLIALLEDAREKLLSSTAYGQVFTAMLEEVSGTSIKGTQKEEQGRAKVRSEDVKHLREAPIVEKFRQFLQLIEVVCEVTISPELQSRFLRRLRDTFSKVDLKALRKELQQGRVTPEFQEFLDTFDELQPEVRQLGVSESGYFELKDGVLVNLAEDVT